MMKIQSFGLALIFACLAAAVTARDYQDIPIDNSLVLKAPRKGIPVTIPGMKLVCWTDEFGSPGIFGECQIYKDGLFAVDGQVTTATNGQWLDYQRLYAWVSPGELTGDNYKDCALVLKDGIGPYYAEINGEKVLGYWTYDRPIGYVVQGGTVYEKDQDFLGGWVLCNFNYSRR